MQKEYNFKSPKTHITLTDNYISLKRGDHDMMIHKSMRGETKVFYSKIVEIKYKKPSLARKGYIQFSTPRTSMLGIARGGTDQPQNAIEFKRDRLQDIEEIKEFIESKMN